MKFGELFPHFMAGGYVPGNYNYGAGTNPNIGAGGPGPVQGSGFGSAPVGGPDQRNGPFYQNGYTATAPSSSLNFTGAQTANSNYGGTIGTAQQNYGTLTNMLMGQANGGGPNPALDQLKQTTDRNIAQARAMAQSNPNNAGALRQVALQTSQANSDASGQAATLRAQQQLSAEQQLGGLTTQGLSSAGQLQNQQNSNTITNWLDPQRLALEQSQGNQTAFGNAQSLNAQTSAQNLAAAQQFQSQAAAATAGLISGVGTAGVTAVGNKTNGVGGLPGVSPVGTTDTSDLNNPPPDLSGTQGDYNTGGGDTQYSWRGGAIKAYADGGEVSSEDRSILDAIHSGVPLSLKPDVGEPGGVSSRLAQFAPSLSAFAGHGGASGSGNGSVDFLTSAAHTAVDTAATDIGKQLGYKGAPISLTPPSASNPVGAPPTQGLPPGATPPPVNSNLPPSPINGPAGPLGGGPSGHGLAHGGLLSMMGGGVPGRAGIQGDNKKNDTVPTMLSPGEIVLPRSVTQDDHAADKAAAFVDAIKRSKMKRAA